MDPYAHSGYGYVPAQSRAGVSVLRGSPSPTSMLLHSNSAHSNASNQVSPSLASSAASRADRSQQINDYVAKQKAAKQNAPLIRKENQRLAEARAMSASRSAKENDNGAEYLDDHSHLSAPSNNDYGRPVSGIRSVPTQNSLQPPEGAARRQSGGISSTQSQARTPAGAGRAPAAYDDGNGHHASNGSGGGGNQADLAKRVVMLEDQIRLLKQQNRIFLSFMQNTEQQLSEIRASQSTANVERSRSRNNGGYDHALAANNAGGAYPNNMSQNTKQVLHRSQSERNTQPPATAASARSQQQQQAQASPTFGADRAGDVDQTFAPLEGDAERKERLKSAKKKKELLNLREKMKKQGTLSATQQPQQQLPPEDDSRGRSYQSNSYQDPYEQQQGGGYGGYGAQPQVSARTAQPQHGLPRTAAAQRGGAPPGGASYPPQQQQQQQQQQREQPIRRAAPVQQQPDYDEYGDGGGFGGGGGNDSFGGGSGVPPGAEEEVETFPCPNCDRRFNRQALEKHVAKQLCKQKPRKVFNMAAKRLEELAGEAREAGIKLPISTKPGAAPAAASSAATARGGDKPLKKQSKWRMEHEKFMAAIQAGKQLSAAMASGVPLSSLPPPPATREEDDDRVPCPHCGRKFNSQVADRHIPHCKNTVNKPKATAASAARLGTAPRKR